MKTKLIVKYIDSSAKERVIEYEKISQAEQAVKYLASKGIEAKIEIKFVKTK